MFLKILSEIRNKSNAAYKNNKNENSSSTAQLAIKEKKDKIFVYAMII